MSTLPLSNVKSNSENCIASNLSFTPHALSHVSGEVGFKADDFTIFAFHLERWHFSGRTNYQLSLLQCAIERRCGCGFERVRDVAREMCNTSELPEMLKNYLCESTKEEENS